MSWLEWVPEVVSGAFGSAVAWFFTRKKNNAEVETTEIENIDKLIAIYRESIEDLGKKLEELRTDTKNQIDLLKKENSELHEEVARLRKLVNKTP